MKRFLILFVLLLFFFSCSGHAAEAEMENMVALDEIEAKFEAISDTEAFSFVDTFQKLMRGDFSFDLKKIPEMISELFLNELRQQKDMALQILIVAVASAVFSNFIKVFKSSQIADISFYMMYLLISTMLLRSFLSMNQIVVNTCKDILTFMEILLPSYLVTLVLSSGSLSAAGFYEVTLLGMNLLHVVVIKLLLPVIQLYLILLILNQMSEEDYFSKFAELIETVVNWGLKSVTGLILGLQAVQCLVTPSVDSLKNSAMQRLGKAIPGICNMIDAAAETVAASAIVIKNAVGTTSILAIAAICLVPILKLSTCILLFRFLCAAIQPVCEKRMVEGIDSISRGTMMLLRILLVSMLVFVLSIAMVTSAVKGG